MGTRSVIYLDGEILCQCGYDGQPYSLGEDLERVTSNWKDILKVCKHNAIWAVNVKYFIRDPKFVFDCLNEKEKKEILKHYPEGVSEKLLKACRKPDPDGVSGIEYVLFKPPSELYEAPIDIQNSYQYNHTNNMVFVRYDYKNFPWVPNDKVKKEEENDTLWRIRDEMCGFIDSSDEDYEIEKKVMKDGPISSGREFLRACEKATQLIPQDPNCWWNYGVALELLGRTEKAVEAYKIATQLTPDNPKIWQILGNFYIKNGRKEKSFQAFGKAISNIIYLDYSMMDYYEKKNFEKNITQLYKTLLKAKFEDLIKPFNESIHSKINFEEVEFLASIQKKVGEPIFSTSYSGYKFESGRIIKLNLSEKSLKSLPESIGSLSSLEELDLSINWLTELPEEMGKLSSLKKLNLKDNKLTSHPDWLKKLPLLEHLEIDPIIPEIDPKEKEVIGLIEAEINRPLPVVRDFKDRKVGYIVKNEHIIGLSLDLEYNYGLNNLPETISFLTSLKKLNLRSNKLTSLPESISCLISLKKLNLSANKFTSLPESIGCFTSLKELNLSFNKLTSLPESIGSLKSLEELKLYSNQLITLPESIGNLTVLKKLLLRNNKLTVLPESIGALKSLEELDLHSNQLIEIPESIENLTVLKKLNLSFNKLTSLPESIGSLKSLEELNLNSNQLIETPESIENLTVLKKLLLRNNKLTVLPESIGALKSLEELDLYSNQLREIPESIGDLALLKKLDLRNNKLTILPESVEKLGKNRILSDIEKVTNSQRKLKDKDRRKLRKSLVFKICLYGPSLAGKSTILNWLYDKESGKVHTSGGMQQDSTKNILFFEWKMVKHPNVIFLIYTAVGDQKKQSIMDGTDAVIFIWDSLIDNWKENVRLLKELLKFYRDKIIPPEAFAPPEVPIVVLADKRDLEDIVEISKIRQALDTAKLNHVLIYETISIQGINVKRAFVYAARQIILNRYKKLSGKALEKC